MATRHIEDTAFTVAGALAYLASLPPDSTVFLCATNPQEIVGRARRDHGADARLYPLTVAAENALRSYSPGFRDEVGIINDIASACASAERTA